MEKEETERKARALLKMLKGKGWKARVWENAGWHYCAELCDGILCIYGTNAADGDEGYYAMMTDERGHPGSGSQMWHDDTTYNDPNKAVINMVTAAREKVNELTSMVSEVEHAINQG